MISWKLESTQVNRSYNLRQQKRYSIFLIIKPFKITVVILVDLSPYNFPTNGNLK